RLLYARIGHPHCPVCGRPIAGQSLEAIVDQVLRLPEGTRFTVNAPVVRDRKGEYKDVCEELRADGFSRVKVDGETYLLEEARVPSVPGPRAAAGDRPPPPRPRPGALDRRGRAGAVVGRGLELLRPGREGDRRTVRDRRPRTLAGAPRGAAEPLPVRHRGRAGL